MLILVSTATGCVSFSAFSLLVCVAVGIKSFKVRLKICPITTGIKKYKSIIKKKKNMHDKMLLDKDKFNTNEGIISEAFINSYIRRDEFVSVINVVTEYNEMKKEIKNSKTSAELTI